MELVNLVSAYRKGEHMTDPRFEKYIKCAKCKTLSISAPEGMAICLDGEMSAGTRLDVEICPAALEIIVPKK